MPHSRPLSILVVEHDRDTADSYAQLLALYGHDVRLAASGPEAVKVVGGFTPDVAILDIGLPGADGYTVARALCWVLPRRPVLIALTGYPDLEAWSKTEGFDHHIVKPSEPAALRDLLAEYADRLAVSG